MGGGSSYTAPVASAPAPESPTVASSTVKGATAGQLLQARAAAGLASTILTGPTGLSTTATTAPKTLLGG